MPLALSEALHSEKVKLSEEEEKAVRSLVEKIDVSLKANFDGSPLQLVFDTSLCHPKLIYETAKRYKNKGWEVRVTAMMGHDKLSISPLSPPKIIGLSVTLAAW